MQKKSLLKKIAPDKWKHFWVGIALGLVLEALFGYWLRAHPLVATIFALLVVMAISYGFEVFSLLTGRGHYDFMDAVASTIGGVVGISLMLWLAFQMQW